MEPLTLNQLLPLLGCLEPPETTLTLDETKTFSGVAVDSRLVKLNDIFFALKGDKVDGHSYLGQAKANGAAAAVVSVNYLGPDHGLALIKVDDPLKALQQLTKAILDSRKTRIVAVTGSVGKTTTKDFITTLLKVKYRVASSPGNHNSQIGLPLTILNHTNGDEEILVLEMGMTHAGNLTNLVHIAPPDIAVVTMVALTHAGNFASLQEIAQAKAEIFSHPKTTLGILLRDLEHFDAMAHVGSCPKVTFSLSTGADYTLIEQDEYLHIHYAGDLAATYNRLPVLGRHNLQNFLAAVAVARNLQLSWEEIRQAIPLLALPERRLQQIEIGGVLFVNDSYNASTVSVKAAFNSLPKPPPGGKTIAVIGQMLELGQFSEMCHREVAEDALNFVDSMICLGDGCKPIWECWSVARRPVAWFSTLEEVVSELRCQMRAGDVVLLKGSRTHGLWRILEAMDSKREL